MKKELSCGAVVFRGRRYLLLHYPAGHWDFPKGHIKKGESVLACARRETEEETGINDLKFIPGFEEKIHYFFKEKGELISKDVIYVLSGTSTKKVNLSFEHTGYAWLPYKAALARLTFPTSKHVLEKAEAFLNASP